MARRASMPSVSIRLGDFTGGEAHVFPVAAMPSKYSARLQNAYISERGGIAKLPGYVKCNTTAVGHVLTSGFEYRQRDGSVEILVAGAGNIYKLASGSLSAIKTGLDAGAKVFFATINDLCIMGNGVDAPLKYDGSTVSNLGGSPPNHGFKPHVHKNRVWFIDRQDKLKAFYCGLNAPEDWTTPNDAGYLDFAFLLRKGDELLDIFTYVDLLVFFFRSHIAIYKGNNPNSGGDFALVQLIEGCGVVQSDTVQGIGTDCGFLYDSGVKNLQQVVTTGNLNLGGLSRNIDPAMIPEIAAGLSGNFASGHYPGLGIYLVLIGSNIWVYSYVWKAWSRMVGADISGIFGTSDNKLYLCGNTGFLYQFGSGWDYAGVSPYWAWQTAWVTLGKGANKYFPKLAEIITYPGGEVTVNVDARYDMNLSQAECFATFTTVPAPALMDEPVPDIWENCFYMDGGNFEANRIPMFGGGRSLRLEFSNTSGDGPIEINDIVLQAVIGGP